MISLHFSTLQGLFNGQHAWRSTFPALVRHGASSCKTNEVLSQGQVVFVEYVGDEESQEVGWLYGYKLLGRRL